MTRVFRTDIQHDSLGRPDSDPEAAAKARMIARSKGPRKSLDGFGLNAAGVMVNNEARAPGPSGSFTTEEARILNSVEDSPNEVSAKIKMAARSATAFLSHDPPARAVAMAAYVAKHSKGG